MVKLKATPVTPLIIIPLHPLQFIVTAVFIITIFVHIEDDTTLVFPIYEGNGLYMSVGNVAQMGRAAALGSPREGPT